MRLKTLIKRYSVNFNYTEKCVSKYDKLLAIVMKSWVSLKSLYLYYMLFTTLCVL